LRVGRAHLVPDGIVVVALLGVVLVEVDHVNGGLGVLLLLLLGDAIAGQHALPFLRQALCTVSKYSIVQAQCDDVR